MTPVRIDPAAIARLNNILMTWPIGDRKNVPGPMLPAFEKIEGARPGVKYIGRTFFKIIWVNHTNPLYEPHEIRIPMDSRDALIWHEDGGVYGWLCGGLSR